MQSPETYIGYVRAENFASPGGFKHDAAQLYRAPDQLALNDWALTGRWKDEGQIATALSAPAGIAYRFHARDLHLVLGPGSAREPIRFRVTLDGKPPAADHGADSRCRRFRRSNGKPSLPTDSPAKQQAGSRLQN